jgi:hypothetical protein
VRLIWREFERSAPGLADLGRGRFAATRVALIGTLRGDGSPRISPIEPYLVRGHLLLGMLAGSHKALDVLRDPRCVVHSSVSDVNGSEGEFKLHGRVVLVTDPDLLRGYDAWWTAKPWAEARVFSLEIESAAYLTWDTKKSEMNVMRWTPDTGLTSTLRPY